ncbi:hypothetical protein D4R99_02810, partial [bacterium]
MKHSNFLHSRLFAPSFFLVSFFALASSGTAFAAAKPLFSKGDTVVTTANLVLRDAAGATGVYVNTVPINSRGKIKEVSTSPISGYWWYKIDYNAPTETKPELIGWSIETWLKKYTEPIIPKPVSSDTTAPSAPANLAKTGDYSSKVILTWAANSDADLAGYKIYRDSALIATVSKQITYTDTQNIYPSTSYSYTIAAYDTAGNISTQSPALLAKTIPQSGSRFLAGTFVMTTDDYVSVRSTPSLLGTLVLPRLAKGTKGTVQAGPVRADNYAWWQIDYDGGQKGWTAENFLTEYISTPGT